MTPATSGPPPPFPGARLLFSLDPSVRHLNHGSFGAVPIGVQRAHRRFQDEVELNPMRHYTRGLAERIGHVRRHLAGFVGADPAGTALVPNATTGVNLVLNSVALGPGDEVLLTDQGYGAVRLAVAEVCRRRGCLSRTVPIGLAATDREIVASVREAVRPERTRLVIVDQVSSPTARHLPAREIVSALRGTGVPVLIDAAHAPGMLAVDVSAVGAHFWVGNLHKWAFTGRGTALLSVAPSWRDRIRPLVVSWQQESGFPDSVEMQGTLDHAAWLAAPVGLHTLRSLGPAEVRAHNSALAAYGQRVIGRALGLDPADLPDPGDPAVSMRVVPLPPGVATTEAGAVHLRERIATQLSTEVAVSCWRGTGLLRLSAQVYNRPEDYEHLADRLPDLLAGARG